MNRKPLADRRDKQIDLFGWLVAPGGNIVELNKEKRGAHKLAMVLR
jgi:hypothetical protein